MKLILSLLFVLFSQTLLAEDCSYKITSDQIQVNWTAFKTPKKVGVNGSFKDLGIKTDYTGSDIAEILKTVKFSIESASVATKNDDRDAKIVKFFFKAMKKGTKITGSIKEYEGQTLLLNIKMNGISKDIPMTVELKDNALKANGVIDLFDFSMQKSLKGINKACFDLHEGKTWNDVQIELQAKFTKICK